MDVGDESGAQDRLETDGEARDRSAGAGELAAGDAGELARLRARERQLQAVADLGFQALADREFSMLIDRAVGTVARALEVDIVAIEETQPDRELIVRAAVGLGEATHGRETAGTGEGSQAGYTLSAGAPVVSDDLVSEARFRPSPVLARNRARSSISVAVGPPQAAYGVLLAATTRPRRFSEDDVTFLHGVSNVLAMAWERGKAEDALRVSEELFREGFDHSPIGMGLADLNGTYIRVNAAFATMLGYQRPEDLVGVSANSVTHPDDRAQNHEAISSMRDAGPWTGEKRFIRTDGEVVHALVGSTLICEQSRGGPVFFNQARDITKLRRAQAQLDETRAQLQSVLDHAPALIYLIDVDGRFLLINNALQDVLGVPREQALGKVREDVLPAAAAAAHCANDLDVIRHGQPILFEETSPLADGEHTYQSVKFPLRDHDGRIYAIGGISSDITEQRHAEHERLEALRASALAESANRAKSEFLARMSHELRTPLNAIIGFSQVLGLEPRHSQDIAHILTAGKHLLALVDDVLDLARIESGQMTISPEPVALANTVHDVLALLAPIAHERHVSLGIDTNGLAHDGHVHADRNRFQQVLLNVLSNAIKYNRPGGRVDVSFQITDGARVRTMIADTGLGIAPAHLDKLFEPFERLGAEQTDVDGTGLGLALSKGLIEAMGGTIEVQSTVGVGTMFVIDLAAAQRPTGEHQPSPRDPLDELGADAKPQLVLYIEDNLSNLTLVERILERRVSVELISAMQGTLGLELARQHRPDLIVLDLHLPDLPGADVLTRLKIDPSTRAIPVIVLTADASGRQSERLLQLGAIDYLTNGLSI